jgi:CRP-like cAMP-binding protein
MFVIVSGLVRQHKGEDAVAELGSGAHFGEMALVDRGRRSASASALETSRLLLIRRKDFFDIIRNENALSVKLLWSFVQVLTERLRNVLATQPREPTEMLDLSDDALLVDDMGDSDAGADDVEAMMKAVESLARTAGVSAPTAPVADGIVDAGDQEAGEDATSKLKLPTGLS